MASFPLLLFSFFLLLHRLKSFNITDQTTYNMTDQKQMLLEFINPLDPDTKLNWKVTDDSPCSWKGVLCDPNNITVIQLILPSAGLTGEITPKTIGYLPTLLVLALPNNHLTGPIPYDFRSLTLSELYLQDNDFSGNLGFINADELESLNVSNNNFNCNIPYSLYYKFPNRSAVFSGNEDLCLNSSYYCNFTYLECPLYDFHSRVLETQTVGVSVGLGFVLLVFICWLPKRINRCRKAAVPGVDQSEGGTDGEGKNKLVFLDEGVDVSGFGGFEYGDLMAVSAAVLGKGSVGTSYKAVMEEKKMTVVVKRLVKDVVVTESEFESQMEVLGKMKCEYVVTLKGYCYVEDEKWLVYDYMPDGSLSARLHGCGDLSETQLNWDHRMKIALSASKGVAYLHDNNIVHGNIKSSNVLLRQGTNIDAVVSDYCLHTLFGKWSSPNHQVMSYWAPEVLDTKEFSFESDVYSFGVLLLELLTGKAPNYQDLEDWNDFPMWVQRVVSKEPNVEIFYKDLVTDQNIDEMLQMLQIAKDCVSIVPNERPTMEKVVSLLNKMNKDGIDHRFGRPIREL